MMLLSIIIPIYNMEIYLHDCLRSLEKQKFDDVVEIILVDDGSTDNSLQVCMDAAKRDSHFHVIHQENQGVSAARNTGLNNAIGEYVAWIDPDDYITNDWYVTVKKELSTSPDMIYFDMYRLVDGEYHEVNFDKISRSLSKRELCEELAVGNRIQSHLWSKIIRRKFFDCPFSNKYSYCEDFAILHYVCWHVKECKYIHKPLYVYRQVENSITNEKKQLMKNILIVIGLYKQRYRFYRSHGMEVSRVGIYLAMFWLCNTYSLLPENYIKHYERIYQICFKVVRKNILELLSSSYIPFCRKMKILCIMVMGSTLYIRLKRKKS